MPVEVTIGSPSDQDFGSLEERVTALEASGGGGGGSGESAVKVYRSGWDGPIERATSLPVTTSGSYWTNLASMAIPGPFKAGDSIECYFEMHGTNDDLRDRGKGVAWVTQSLLSPNENDGRDFTVDFALNWANGSWNVGVEAHHALLARSGVHTFAADHAGPLFFKVVSHAKSKAAVSGDRFDISQWRGILRATHYGV